ncbi:M48 family metallopeptidase [Faecalispora anaeroviscerum]|uniref:M48 family metallopeptidase n=1 Tax=Faecalispora anaeroviscerum TaxID=2991836 RepID=UPI0024B9CF8D|nr:M48 family metallopeptidase [Faecalispora anaeroviscerum]
MKPEYTLIRSSRKTLSLEITRDAAVVVRAPKRCPQSEIDLFVTQREDWIHSALKRQRCRMEQHPEPSAAEREQLICRAKEILPERVAYYANLMELHPTGLTITGAVSRFGSCSPKNRLCFSWRLMQYPMPAVDYVVVHELAHIRHKNHGKDFYALVQSVLPDYRERWQLLKK